MEFYKKHPGNIVNYNQQPQRGECPREFRPPQSTGAKPIAAIFTNDEVHKVETAGEDLLLGDEAE